MDDAPPSIFGIQIPILGQKDRTISNLDISGIHFDGNYNNQNLTPEDHGKGFHNFIGLTNCSKSKFHDLAGGYNEGDYFRFLNSYNLEFSECTGAMGGHDWIHLRNCNYVSIFDNHIQMRSNNAIRVRNSSNVSIFSNVCIGTNFAYAPAIQLENIDPGAYTSNIQIYGNTLQNVFGPGIWLIGGGETTCAKNVSIKNNLITNCGIMPASNGIAGVGGIVCDGFTAVDILNNTIDSCKGYGILFGEYLKSSTLSKLSASIQRNIISNTKEGNSKGHYSGAGIVNLISTRYELTCSENCFYNNHLNNPDTIHDSSAIFANPQYVGNGDYHLLPDSPAKFSSYELGRYGTLTYCDIIKKFSAMFESCTQDTIGNDELEDNRE